MDNQSIISERFINPDPRPLNLDGMLGDFEVKINSVMTTLMPQNEPPDPASSMQSLLNWLVMMGRKVANFIEDSKAAQLIGRISQQEADELWDLVISKSSGRIVAVLPRANVSGRIPPKTTKAGVVTESVPGSYEAAVDECRAKVQAIIRQCKRANQKFHDEEFDLDDYPMCLRSIIIPLDKQLFSPLPQSVARLEDIFEKPERLIEGATADDIRQGRGGNCWFLAAVAALTNVEGGTRQNYVEIEGDKESGVYGFVFHRGGFFQPE